MLASSFLDPVLGIDIHFEMVPTPAPVPLPIPNPFVGVVFDPMGLAAGIAIGAVIGAVVGAPFQGPVLYWTAFPATNTGTEAKHVPGHILIPPGTAWAPFPKTPKPVIHPGETPKPAAPVKPENDAVVITGSKTVTVMGSNAVRIGDLALSCSEPLRLPSSVVLAIPKGAPILVGGPPSLDIMAALMGSLRTRFVSDSLHALLSRLKPSRFRNLLHRVVCFFTGHPVDVASGKVMTEFVDIELPGPLPLKVERIYSSAFASRCGPLGHGWSLSLDQGLWRERGKVVLLAEDGREIEFDTFDFPRHRIEPGQRVYNPIERLTLHCDESDAWRVVDADGITRHFAPVPGRGDGRAMIRQIRSRCGFHPIDFHYDAKGRLEWVRDCGGRFVRLVHDDAGRVTELHLPQPQGEGLYRHRRYAYDDAGDLVRVTDSLGHDWRFAYVTHLLTQETDRNGLSFYFQYDGLGEDAWCVRTWGDGGIYDHVLAYDKRKRVTYVTNSLGHTTQYHMNLVGQVVKVVDPLGAETAYEYDPVTLQLTKERDALDATMDYHYDQRGNLLHVVTPTNGHIQWSYDRHGQKAHAIDANGGHWQWTYDRHHRLASSCDPTGAVTRYGYASGRLTTVEDPLGLTRLRYDDNHNLVEVISTNHGTSRWQHDRLGGIVTLQDVQGARQARRIDPERRVVEVHEPDGNIRHYHYDAEGRITTARDRQSRVEFSYSGVRCLARREEGSDSMIVEHDTEEQIISMINPSGLEHRYVRNERGDIIEEVDFGGGRTRYERDIAGRVTTQQWPSGRTASFRYDHAGHLLSAEYSDGRTESFSYRSDGLLVGAVNPECTVALARDPLGRVTREQQDEHWVEISYDLSGLRTSSRTSLSTTQAIRRNSRGDVVEIEARGGRDLRGNGTSWRASIERDSAGLVVSCTLPGDVERRFAHDRSGRLTEHSVSTPRSLILRQAYQFGWNERILRMWHGGAVETVFEHDPLGNLISSTKQGNTIGRYVDAVGNVYSAPGLDDRRYDDVGRVLEIFTPREIENTYDPDGNLIQKEGPDGIWSYHWNSAGRLESVEPPSGEQIRFSYDALGRRIRKEVGDQITTWVWDHANPVHEIDPNGEVISWIFEPDTISPIAKLLGDCAWSIIGDHLGTPLALIDEDGSTAWRADLDIWGAAEVSQGNATDCPFRWPGQYADHETGLYYNRFRYYDPSLGTYLSRDPLGRQAGMSDYSYVPDPTRWIDPLGLIILYHYTDEAGLKGILQSNTIRPSTAPKNTKFGVGQYFTDISPSKVAGRTLADLSAADKAANKISLGQLAKELYGDTRRMSTCAFFVAIDLDDSMVKFCRPGTYVINNVGDLDIKGRVKESGKTCG